MRRKCDFVTNSSSVSFVLKGKACGRVPTIADDLPKLLRERFPRSDHYPEEGAVVYASSYAIVKDGVPSEDDEDAPQGSYEMTLINTHDWDEEHDDVVGVTAITINVVSPLIYVRNHPVIMDRVLFLLNQILPKDSHGELYFAQMPTEMEGGGLDGGDPMGPYEWSFDILRCETKSGKIKIKDGNPRGYVKWVKCKEEQ